MDRQVGPRTFDSNATSSESPKGEDIFNTTANSFYEYIFTEFENTKIQQKVLPVMLSHRMRDVIIRPNGLKRASRSCWVMFFGKPETYKFAPLMASELGLA